MADTTITLDDSTVKRLWDESGWYENYDTVINRLLDRKGKVRRWLQ
jgi:hypothetical protein